ncbi:hypothetical protein A6X21_12230 [Planctopirus hydrillae]|uniref:Uncharacterized protein n=1 Tax=Planctopirus hydrillae TaxID=1841610 RepID=A0A1C3E5P9_9PLAN|nr:hypothetical protein A6X21_12230 [Planctopirus hydrillae]
MFKAIMMGRNIAGAIILADGDDRGPDEDIRPLPPGAKTCLPRAASMAHSRMRQGGVPYPVPLPRRHGRGLQRGMCMARLLVVVQSHNDPATSWPGHPCPAVVDYGQIRAVSMFSIR